MRKSLFLSFWIILLAHPLWNYTLSAPLTVHDFSTTYDTIDKQLLYNGRVWRNLYGSIEGDQFLFSKEFLPGTITIEGKVFTGLKLKYDIFKDELLTVNENRIIIQLNKERVDKFSFVYDSRTYNFQRLDPDSINNLSGYFNVLYDGKCALYVKYRKEILPLAVDNKYDLFSESYRIYLRKEGKIYQINNRIDFLRLMNDRKKQIRSFIKSKKLKISRKNPDSFEPVVEYYDKLKQ